MNEDLLTLIGLYTLTIREERGSWGTFPSASPDRDISVTITVIAENQDTRLTGSGHVSGKFTGEIDLREKALAAALADVAGQAQALAKHKGYRS